MRAAKCFVILVLMAVAAAKKSEKMRMIHSWKKLEFAYPKPADRDAAIKNGDFVPGAPVPIDVDVYHGVTQKVFISVPRFQNGVPVTIGYVTESVTPEGNPVIAPYPNWEFNKLGNCDGVTSVYRMKVDNCNRLWILDTGKLDDKWICSPKLHIFDLLTNKLIRQYKFPDSQLKQDSLLVTVAVDIREKDGCEKPFAYVADVTGFGLLVYDYEKNVSWRINNNLFYPYPPQGTFLIKGETFDLMDGILGLALGPVSADGDRILYFHSLASRVESRVPTSVIRNHELFKDNPDAAARSFVPFEMKRSSQSAAQAMDRNGVLYFGLMTDLAIGCWNSVHYSEFGGPNNEIIVQNPETLQFVSGMKVIWGKDGRQELWALTPSFQKVMTGTLNANQTNFRIQAGIIDVLTRGTKCDVGSLGILGSRFRMMNHFSK